MSTLQSAFVVTWAKIVVMDIFHHIDTVKKINENYKLLTSFHRWQQKLLSFLFFFCSTCRLTSNNNFSVNQLSRVGTLNWTNVLSRWITKEREKKENDSFQVKCITRQFKCWLRLIHRAIFFSFFCVWFYSFTCLRQWCLCGWWW